MPSALNISGALSGLLGDLSEWGVIVPSILDPTSDGVAVRHGVAAARWALLIKDLGSVVVAVDTHVEVCLHIMFFAF